MKLADQIKIKVSTWIIPIIFQQNFDPNFHNNLYLNYWYVVYSLYNIYQLYNVQYFIWLQQSINIYQSIFINILCSVCMRDFHTYFKYALCQIRASQYYLYKYNIIKLLIWGCRSVESFVYWGMYKEKVCSHGLLLYIIYTFNQLESSGFVHI